MKLYESEAIISRTKACVHPRDFAAGRRQSRVEQIKIPLSLPFGKGGKGGFLDKRPREMNSLRWNWLWRRRGRRPSNRRGSYSTRARKDSRQLPGCWKALRWI